MTKPSPKHTAPLPDFEQVKQVLARYVRATDQRDGNAMAALFLPTGIVEIFHHAAGQADLLGTLEGPEAIAAAVNGMMAPHPDRGWSHHTTHDALVAVDGDQAHIDAQFIVFNTLGDACPAGGWPTGAHGAQGTVTPIEAGYYRCDMRRSGGKWMMERHRIFLDLPMAIPAGG